MPENEEFAPENENGAAGAASTQEDAKPARARGRGRAPLKASPVENETQAPENQSETNDSEPKRRGGRPPRKTAPEATPETGEQTDRSAGSESSSLSGATAGAGDDASAPGEEVRPKRKKRKKKKRPAGDVTPEWEDIAGEEAGSSDRRGPRGLNDFSRQRDGNRGDRRDGRNDGRGNDRRNDGRNNNDRNQNNRRGTDNRPIGVQPKKKKAGLWPALGFALRGVGLGFAREVHIAIHFAAALLVLAAAWWLNIPAGETALVVLAIGGVLAAEYLNAALETLADAVHPRPNGGIGKAKDIAAGGVLLASMAAVGVGLLVFGPAIWSWIQGLLG